MANRLLDLYGLGDQPSYSGDGDVYTTASLMPGIDREQAYKNSMFGKVANWLEGKGKGLENATMFNPVVMGLEGAGTMNRWAGAAAGYGDQLQPQDVLAPLGLSAMAAPFLPRGAVGSAGGRLAAGASENALDMSHEARMARAREMGFDTDNILYHGTDAVFDEFKPSTTGALGPGVYGGKSDAAGVYAMQRKSNGNPSVIPYMVRGRMANWDELKAAYEPYFVGDVSMSEAMARGAADIRAGGASGIYVSKNNAVVFDPRNIRSVNAAFDPAKADSANLLAADQARGALPGTVVNALEDRGSEDELLKLLRMYGVQP